VCRRERRKPVGVEAPHAGRPSQGRLTHDVRKPAEILELAYNDTAGVTADFNLNLLRYIDSTDLEDLQDIDDHLRVGIPERDIDAYSDPNRHPFRWQIDTRSDPNRHLFRRKSTPLFRVS